MLLSLPEKGAAKGSRKGNRPRIRNTLVGLDGEMKLGMGTCKGEDVPAVYTDRYDTEPCLRD